MPCPLADASSLALLAEKPDAHSAPIASVAYNNDGTKIVSACYGGTIKVWDAGVNAEHTQTLMPSPDHLPVLAAASLELKAEKQSAHSRAITSVTFSNDGTKIVSGSGDRTIKVWDAGVNADPHPDLVPI